MSGRHRISSRRHLPRGATPIALGVALGLLVAACAFDLASEETGSQALAETFVEQAAVLTEGVVPVPLLEAWAVSKETEVRITQGALVEAMESGDLVTARYLTTSLSSTEIPRHVQPGYDFETGWATSTDALDRAKKADCRLVEAQNDRESHRCQIDPADIDSH